MTSKPSDPPSLPNDQGRWTTSWAIPEPADVISFSYLWASEAAKGQEEGLKDRPVVVVLARIVRDDVTRLIVAPITHSQPPAGGGVEIHPSVKRNLGLDDQCSWIITTEVNQFIWPGPDVRPAKGLDTPLYGAIPAKLFDQTRQQISDNAQAKQAVITKRTE